ncbi:MAG: DUF4386 family protein [Thermoleophilaceae bacterium]
MTQTRAEQLDWEARAGRPAAAAAVATMLLGIAGNVLLASALSDRPDGDAGTLVVVERESGSFIAASALTGASLLLLIPLLGYLYRATRFRREQLRVVAIIGLVFGATLAAVIAVATAVAFTDAASDFVDGTSVPGMTREDRAEDAIDDSALPVLQQIGLAGNLALGLGVVLIALNAMRAGLVSRFLGVIGIIVGVLYVLPLTGGPQIVQLFWLGALAALFFGRWPGGRGPAWEAGEAVPWPSAAEQARNREEQSADARSENGRGSGDAPESADPDVPRPRSRKRKKRNKR